MKKSIQIALTSIALILTSILGLTIMLHGMYSKINVKGAAESRASNNMANISSSDSDYSGYQNLIESSWLVGGNVRHDQITIRELGSSAKNAEINPQDLNDIIRASGNPYGKVINGISHFWFSIRWNVKANLNDFTLPPATVVHILLNGYSISGNFKINTFHDNSALKLYDYAKGNINNGDDTYYFGHYDPQTNNRPVRFYRYDSNKNAYSAYIDAVNSIGQTTTRLPSNVYTDVTSNPRFNSNNNYIKVDGSVIGPGPKENGHYDQNAIKYEATTQLKGNIELYGVNIVGNNSPASNGGILSTFTSNKNTIRLYNCTIIGNNVQNDKTTALNLGDGGNVNLKWCNIYGNYAGDHNTYGTVTNIADRTSDIYAPSNIIMNSVDLQKNELGNVATNNNKKGGIFLRETNLNSLHVASSNVRASLVDTIGNNRITGTLWLCEGGSFIVNQNCPNLSVKIERTNNRLTLNSNGKINNIRENSSASATTYIINGGHIGNHDTLATKNGTVEINSGSITLEGTPTSVYGNGTAILNGISTIVPSGKTLNILKHKNNSTVRVNGTVTYIRPEGGSGTGDTIINDGGRVNNISSKTVTVNFGGNADSVTGGTTVNMNGGSATITSGTSQLYGTSGRVTIGDGNTTIAEARVENILSQNTLSATVIINSAGRLTIASSASVGGSITNGGILNVAGTANNINFGAGNTGTVNMQAGGSATITSGSGKLSGNSGQVTINNSATATVENVSGRNTLGANVTIDGTTGTLYINSGATVTGQIINNGVLNVAGTASGATITNNKTLNLKQGGSIPGNFTNNANGTLVVESGVTYTITANSLGGTITNQGILTIQNNLAANITNQGRLTITNGLNATITNQGTLTIQNGTVQTLDNQSGKEVIIDSGANSNNRVTIDNLTNNGTFTVHSGTYIIPNNKTLSGKVVNETNGIIELQGTLSANPFINNGSLRIPRNKTFTIDANGSINGLSGKILNSGILNVNGALNSNATLTNEEHGTVNLGSNGTLPNNFTNNGTLVIPTGVNKTITAPNGTGIIRNQGQLTISGNATVVNNKAANNSNVTLTITGGTVNTSGSVTSITVTQGTLNIQENAQLTADTITANNRMTIFGTVIANTKIDANSQFHIKPGGKVYGTVNISNNAVQPIIEGIIGDASHSNSVLNISSGQTVEARNGANIWNVTGNGQLELRQANTVVHVRGEFNGTIQNYNGIVNLYENARVGTLRDSASANDKGIYIKGARITITTLSSTGRFTIEQNGVYILKNNQILNGTVINNGILTLEEGCTLTNAFTNTGTFNIEQNVRYRIANTELGGTINNRGTLYVGENTDSGIARDAHVTNSGTIYVKSNFSSFTNQDLTQQGNGKLILQSSNPIIIERATWTGGTIENSGSFKMYGTLKNCTVKNTAGEFFSRGSMTGNIEQTGGEVFVDENLTGNITTTGGNLYIGSPALSGTVTIGENARAKICGILGENATVINNSNQLEIGKDIVNNTTKIGNVYNLKGTGNFTVKDGATVAIRDTNTLTGRNESGNLHLYTSMKSLTNSSIVSIKGSDVTVTNTLNNTGTFQIESTGSFTIKDSQTLGGITTIDNSGSLVVNGIVDDVSGNGRLTINTNGDKKGQATVKATKSLDGTITNTGILNIQGTLTATTTFTNNGELNLAENVSYTVLNSMNLSGIINNRGTLTIEGSAKVVNNYNNLTVDGTIDVVTNNNITKNTNAQVTVNGTVKDLSGNSTVNISSSANVTVVEGKEITGIVTNNNGTLTVNGRADDVSGNGILTINTNGDKIGEVTVKAGKTLSGNVTNNGILNMNGTLDIPNFTNDGTFNLNQGADILNPFTNNGTFQIGQDVTYQVREQDNLINGTVVNNGVLTVGVGTIKNLVSTGTTDIQANANVTTLVVSEGYTTLYADSIVGTAELKANGTLEIFNKADLTNLTDNEGGRLIDHRIGPQAIMGTRGFPWLWILIIISGTLLLILLILILLLIKRKREKVYADEIYDRIEDISLYSSNENN